MVKSTFSSHPRQDLFSTKRSSQSSLHGLKLPEDSTRKSRLKTSKRRELERLLESKRPSLVCLLMKSEEEELKTPPSEIRLLRLPRRKSEKETLKRCKPRKPLLEARRIKLPPKLQLLKPPTHQKPPRSKSGVGAVYNGIGVSVVGIIPYRGVYFGLFDTLSGYNPYQKSENSIARASSKFLCAQTSAIAAGYASYPFDTVRRRLQMQSEKPESEWVYKGTADCFGKIMKDEGTAALFKGAGANALRTVGAAMVLVLYSEITAYVNPK